MQHDEQTGLERVRTLLWPRARRAHLTNAHLDALYDPARSLWEEQSAHLLPLRLPMRRAEEQQR